MRIKVHDGGAVYDIEAPEGSEVSRHGHKRPVLGESLDDVLRVPTADGLLSLPTPLVIHCARQGRFGLRIISETEDST